MPPRSTAAIRPAFRLKEEASAGHEIAAVELKVGQIMASVGQKSKAAPALSGAKSKPAGASSRSRGADVLDGAVELWGSRQPRRPSRLWRPLRGADCSPKTGAASGPARRWLEPVRFDYRVSGYELALVFLLADLDAALGAPSTTSLVVRRAGTRSSHGVSAAETRTTLRRPLLWLVSFEVPLDVVEYPRALFSLEAPDRVAIALPAPGLRADVASVANHGPRQPFRPLLRRGATALAAGVALAGTYGSCTGVAMADAGATGTPPTTNTAGPTPTAAMPPPVPPP